jgi:hypothetical protein
VIGISVDAPAQAAALTEKLGIPFPLLSDPDGAAAIWPFGVWDADGSMARPATIALQPGGLEIARFEGTDYADRPVEEELLDRVRELGLRPRELRSGRHPFVEPQPSETAFPRESLPAYFRAVRSAARAIYARTGAEEARLLAELGGRYYDAVKKRL